MARNLGTVLFNNFSKGLITEATGLNFPDNAVADAENVVFHTVGKVSRRKGIDIELGGSKEFLLRGAGPEDVFNEFIWESVSKNGGFTFFVLQAGRWVRFYKNPGGSTLSDDYFTQFDLETLFIPGGFSVGTRPVSFTSGMGYLFLTHPSCSPALIQYDDILDKLILSPLSIVTRDTTGVPDGLSVDAEPKTLTAAHAYNLKNQSWYQKVRVGTVDNEPKNNTPEGSTPSFDLEKIILT